MITKGKALDALNKIRNPMFPVAYDALRQYIEETADLRRQLAEAQARLAELEGQEPVAVTNAAQLAHLKSGIHPDIPMAMWAVGVSYPSATIPLYARTVTSPADQKDAARLTFLYSGRKTESNALIEIEVRLLNGDVPSMAEVRAAIDAAMLAASPGGRNATPPDSPAHRAAKVLMEALRELVACKNIKNEIEAIKFAGPCSSHGEHWIDAVADLEVEYIKRKPDAWIAACEALATAKQIMEGGE